MRWLSVHWTKLAKIRPRPSQRSLRRQRRHRDPLVILARRVRAARKVLKELQYQLDLLEREISTLRSRRQARRDEPLDDE